MKNKPSVSINWSSIPIYLNLMGNFQSITGTDNGFIGYSTSNSNYEFPRLQRFRIISNRNNGFIEDFFIYFDKENGYATDITIEYYISIDNWGTLESHKQNTNNIFYYKLPTDRLYSELRITFNKWSKVDKYVKVLKVATDFNKDYNYRDIMSVEYKRDKTTVPRELRFGVTTDTCTLKLFDRDGVLKALNDGGGMPDNTPVNIKIDDTIQGTYYINESSNNRNSQEWIFYCIDKLSILQENIVDMIPIANRNVYEITNIILNSLGTNIIWESEAKTYCESISINNSYMRTGQSLYQTLLKCCQVGLLRIYVDRLNKIKVTSGVN